MEKALFYLGHPAHFHLFKELIRSMRSAGKPPVIVIKEKDVLETLLQAEGWDYHKLKGNPEGGKLSHIKAILGRFGKLRKIIRQSKANMLLGSTAELGVLGRLFRIPSLIFFEDDFEQVAQFARVAGPYATTLVCPESCSAWKWEHKTLKYPSYHELAYLHPNYFTPDKSKVASLFAEEGKTFLVRFANLNAYHDDGRSGITTEIAQRLIEILKPYGRVYITAERELEAQFEPYRIAIPPENMHHALFYADLYIGDSQTMAAEAAVLGTPSVRFNDFVGRLGYLEELEHRFGLTTGIRTTDPDRLYQVVEELASTAKDTAYWLDKRKKMLGEMMDFAAFTAWLVQEYPHSVDQWKNGTKPAADFISGANKLS